MWTRKELKEKGKIAFKKNYWAAVAICFIIAILTSSYNSSTSGINSFNSENNTTKEVATESSKITNSDIIRNIFNIEGSNEALDSAINDMTEEQSPIFRTVASIYDFAVDHEIATAIILLLSALITIGIIVLVENILLVGEASFFLKNSKEDHVAIGTILDGFKTNYKLNIITMLKKSVYYVLWSITIVMIPVKYYEYKMIPYILATNPQLTSGEVIRLSKKMMYGNKMKSFLLDLSFLGWAILTICTFGLVGILYFNPYKTATYTELYNTLSKEIKAN